MYYISAKKLTECIKIWIANSNWQFFVAVNIKILICDEKNKLLKAIFKKDQKAVY